MNVDPTTQLIQTLRAELARARLELEEMAARAAASDRIDENAWADDTRIDDSSSSDEEIANKENNWPASQAVTASIPAPLPVKTFRLNETKPYMLRCD